jgi:hypothetical protein
MAQAERWLEQHRLFWQRQLASLDHFLQATPEPETKT